MTATDALGQQDRRDLADRLQRFEAGWETADTVGRARSLAVVPDASKQFLSLRPAEAGRTLDRARRKLGADADDPVAAWVDALGVRVGPRLVDATDAGKLTLILAAAYPVKGDVPDGLVLVVQPVNCCVQPAAGPTEVKLVALPMTVEVRHVARDGFATDYDFSVRRNGRTVARLGRVSRLGVKDLDARLGKLKTAADLARKAPVPTLETATLVDLADRLRGLAAGDVPEADPPLADFLRVAEQVAAAPGEKRFSPPVVPPGTAPGLAATYAEDVALSVPTTGGAVTPCRLLAPVVPARKKAPVVLALHGAGGSENMFFDAYGAGCVVKHARQRGWFVVSPRSGLFGAPPSRAILEELATRYPIDLGNVFVVGHSMGAAQAVELAQGKGFALKAVATLGGGGRVRDPKAFADLPAFVGVGSADFALKSSRTLGKALTESGAKRVTLKEYPDVEHLLIVRVAVDDVFAGWDKLLAGK